MPPQAKIPLVFLFVAVTFLIVGALVVGCSYPDPSGNVVKNHGSIQTQEPNCLLPPKYDLGDSVAVVDGLKVGIIVNHRWATVDLPLPQETWVYSVMFQNNTIEYTEEKLELVEKFDWSRPAKEGIVD
mgnify:CR=1 FL=1